MIVSDMRSSAVRSVLVLALAPLAIACSRGPAGAPRLLLVGVDGADPQIVERLIGEGKLPTFAKLMREGAYGPLRSREPILSPLVWTTIVTGRKAQDHGILDFVEAGPDGTPVPITSVQRKVPALWNILTEFGHSSGFVGWYASFPAESTKGFQVSDRLGFHQVRSARATAGATFPEGLAAELRAAVGEAVPDMEATRARFLADPKALVTPGGVKRLEQLARIYATSEMYRKAAPWLQEHYPVEVLGVYFELVDACGHLFMEDAPPPRPEVVPADYAAFSATVDRCYAYQDEVLADLMRLAGRETVTMVVSDHGFRSGDLRPRTSGRADTGLAGLWHRLHGVVFIHGGPAKAGARIEGASIFDVAPTVLSLLRVPLSPELTGHPLEAAFQPGALPAGVRPVQQYAPAPPRALPAEVEPDPEAIERLRALGYIAGPGSAVPHDSSSRTAASYVNEGTARSVDGDEEGALAAFAKALELDSRNVNALVFTARIRTRRGEIAEARALSDRALAINPRSSAVRLQRAFGAIETGAWRLASEELAAAEAIDDRLPNLHFLKARLANVTGHPDRALAELRTARELTDAEALLAEIDLFHSRIATETGRFDEAEAALAEAVRIAPEEAVAAARGELALARGRFAEAARLLGVAVEANPGDSLLERKLGEALGGAGSHREAEAAFRKAADEAKTREQREGAYGDLSLLFQKERREDRVIEVLEEATRALPESAALWGMLGAAYGRSDRLDKAIRAYERSVALGPTPLACKTLAALVFETRRDRPRAVSLWKQSLSLDPRQEDVREMLRLYGR
jgi:predicted AlkP superfamily phosphohydrolase/phosphomutase/tetratricopeptide (TPR) repeat protein